MHLILMLLRQTNIAQDPENAELLPDVELLERKITEATKAMEDAESIGDKRKAAELKEDLMRLKRVEQIYVGLQFSF